jgi:PAS domain S-box-containing protein
VTPIPLRVLMVEDMPDDAELVLRELRRHGFDPAWRRVETAADLHGALTSASWDVVLSDFTVPGFGAEAALEVVRTVHPDLPVLVVSGSVGEDRAVAVMRAGANDWISKDRMSRLGPAIERELREFADRQAHARTEASFQTLVESFEDVVFTFDRDSRLTGVYGRGAPRLGLDPAALLGTRPADIAPPATAAVMEEHAQRALAGEPTQFEWTLDVGGKPVHLQTRLSPLRIAGEVVGVVGIHRDVTAEKTAATQLAVADRMATIGTMAAGVAHEINNPLASALLNLDLARRELRSLSGPSADKLRAAIDDAHAATEQVRSIARDLRLFARGDDAYSAAVELTEVLRSSARMAWNQIRHRARIVEDFAPVPPVTATASRLGQVFLNLMVNAADAIGEGAAERNAITIRTRTATDGRAVVEVADTGSGMPREVLDRLFTPFFTTKPLGVGTGLGLSICHRIVTGLGGTIEVDSEVGRGTTFRVTLPAADRPAVAARAAAAPTGGAAVRRGRILVVDDEAMVARAVRRSLEGVHDVALENSARSALARIQGGDRFDVILCDLMMPEMSGAELHRALATAAPEQAGRMVFMTGGAFSPAARSFLESVDNPRLEKPFDPTQVLDLLARLLS